MVLEYALGTAEVSMHDFDTSIVSTVFPINSKQFVIAQTKGLSIIENGIQRKRLNYTSIASVFISEIDVVVGIAVNKPSLYAFSLKDQNHFMIKDIPLNQNGVNHIIYSPLSKTLITFGSGIKIWTVSWSRPRSKVVLTPNDFKITFERLILEEYETTIMNSPVFDYQRELIYVPTDKGIVPYNLLGQPQKRVSLYPATRQMPFSLNQKSKKLIISDPSEGLLLWHRSGYLISRLNFASASILSLAWVDKENVVILTSSFSIYLMNVKTGFSNLCYIAGNRPTRLFIFNHAMAVVFGSRVTFLEVTIPWFLWANNIVKPKSITRINRIGDPARIVVLADNSFIGIYSGKTNNQINAAIPTDAAQCKNYFYGRECFIEYRDDLCIPFQLPAPKSEDRLYGILDSGKVISFDTTVIPAKPEWVKDLNACFMDYCIFRGRWCLFTINSYGDLFLYDYDEFRLIKRVSIRRQTVFNIFFEKSDETLIILFESAIVKFSLRQERIISFLEADHGTASCYRNGTLQIGQKNGEIVRFKTEGKIVKIGNDFEKSHTDAITGFALVSKYTISCSIDATIRLWDSTFIELVAIRFPMPIYSIGIMNGKRDLLIGTNSSIMRMDGTWLFGDEVDTDVAGLDLFDKLDEPYYFNFLKKEDDLIVGEPDIEPAGGAETVVNKEDMLHEMTKLQRNLVDEPRSAPKGKEIDSKFFDKFRVDQKARIPPEKAEKRELEELQASSAVCIEESHPEAAETDEAHIEEAKMLVPNDDSPEIEPKSAILSVEPAESPDDILSVLNAMIKEEEAVSQPMKRDRSVEYLESFHNLDPTTKESVVKKKDRVSNELSKDFVEDFDQIESTLSKKTPNKKRIKRKKIIPQEKTADTAEFTETQDKVAPLVVERAESTPFMPIIKEKSAESIKESLSMVAIKPSDKTESKLDETTMNKAPKPKKSARNKVNQIQIKKELPIRRTIKTAEPAQRQKPIPKKRINIKQIDLNIRKPIKTREKIGLVIKPIDTDRTKNRNDDILEYYNMFLNEKPKMTATIASTTVLSRTTHYKFVESHETSSLTIGSASLPPTAFTSAAKEMKKEIQDGSAFVSTPRPPTEPSQTRRRRRQASIQPRVTFS